MTPWDVRRALRARKAGARHAFKIVRYARKHGVPLAWAFALVEQETGPIGSPLGFRNVFGCDQGTILCHQKVSREKVQRLLAHIRRGGVSNGVGVTQLTWPPFLVRAEQRGGAHKVSVQLDVGFEIAAAIARDHGWDDIWRYNGALSYQAKIQAKRDRWQRIIFTGR